jgi:polar amino acid transport system substrate-binding protein
MRSARGRGRRNRATSAVVALTGAALLFAGCGKREVLFTGQDDTATTASTVAGSALLPLPVDIRQAKVVTVGSDLSYPPMESIPAGTQAPQGFDVDVANAIGAKLGVQFAFQNVKFSDLVSGLVAEHYDIVMSAMKDTGVRRDAGIDFVDYLQSGVVLVVRKGNPKKIATPADLCGRSVGVLQGTLQADLATSQATECAKTAGGTTTTLKGASGTTSTTRPRTTTTGKSVTGKTATTVARGKLTVQPYADDATALAKLKANVATANLDELAPAANAVLTQPGVFEIAGEQIQAVPFGIGVRQADNQLRDSIVSALRAIVADGTYAQLLEKWGLGLGAVPSIDINTG